MPGIVTSSVSGSTSCIRVYFGGAVCNAGCGCVPRANGIPLVTSVDDYVLSRPVSIAGFNILCTNTRGGITPTNIAVMVVHGSLVNGTVSVAPAVLGCAARCRGNSVFGAPPYCTVCVTNLAFG